MIMCLAVDREGTVIEDGAMTYALPEGDSGDRDRGGGASSGPVAYAGASATQPAWGWGLACAL